MLFAFTNFYIHTWASIILFGPLASVVDSWGPGPSGHQCRKPGKHTRRARHGLMGYSHATNGEPFAESPLRRHLASSTLSSNSPEIKKSLTLVLVVSSVFLPGQARSRGERLEAPRARPRVTSPQDRSGSGEPTGQRPGLQSPGGQAMKT